MARKPKIHLCVDRIVPAAFKLEAARIAREENDENHPKIKLPFGASGHPMKMAIQTGKKWANGRVIGVRFMDGSRLQRKKTQQYAEKWSEHANITFNFGAGTKADIRVSFVADDGAWSAVGVDCLQRAYFPKNEPTMNFGWLRDDTEEEEWERVVVHEFGHALGAIHEHQNPKGGIRWNRKAVYAYFGAPPNSWSRDEIDANVIDKYSIDQLNATTYDPRSIMLYSFPKDLILNKVRAPENWKMSAGDRRFIAKMYPKKRR